MSLEQKFKQAALDAKRLNNATKSELLELYGLFKQASGETFDPSKKGSFGFLDFQVPHEPGPPSSQITFLTPILILSFPLL
jgi:hypothetical protein